MKMTSRNLTLWFVAAAFFIAAPAVSPQKPPSTRTPIFAVIDGGKIIEPIGIIDGGKFVSKPDEGEDKNVFVSSHYKPKTTYSLIFGGAPAGSVGVVSSNVGADCSGSSANVTVHSDVAKLSTFVMGLAGNVKFSGDPSSYRRRPSVTERTEAEALVRAAFRKNGASAAAVRKLRYHNLTAVDVEGDGAAEFVGTYWVAPTPNERRLLFFIAERKKGASLAISHSDHSIVKPDDLMSGELKDLERGIVSELLVDLLDYDNDGIKEIFTMLMAFEGNNYYVYKRDAGKWTKVRQTYVYRCAY